MKTVTNKDLYLSPERSVMEIGPQSGFLLGSLTTEVIGDEYDIDRDE